MKPVVGAFLMILGVLLFGGNILAMLGGSPPAVFAFGLGGCAFFIGFKWVKGENAITP